jgi:hypothetical protein
MVPLSCNIGVSRQSALQSLNTEVGVSVAFGAAPNVAAVRCLTVAMDAPNCWLNLSTSMRPQPALRGLAARNPRPFRRYPSGGNQAGSEHYGWRNRNHHERPGDRGRPCDPSDFQYTQVPADTRSNNGWSGGSTHIRKRLSGIIGSTRPFDSARCPVSNKASEARTEGKKSPRGECDLCAGSQHDSLRRSRASARLRGASRCRRGNCRAGSLVLEIPDIRGSGIVPGKIQGPLRRGPTPTSDRSRSLSPARDCSATRGQTGAGLASTASSSGKSCRRRPTPRPRGGDRAPGSSRHARRHHWRSRIPLFDCVDVVVPVENATLVARHVPLAPAVGGRARFPHGA